MASSDHCPSRRRAAPRSEEPGLQAPSPDTPAPTPLTSAAHGLAGHRPQQGCHCELLPSSTGHGQHGSPLSHFLQIMRDPSALSGPAPPPCTDPSGSGPAQGTRSAPHVARARSAGAAWLRERGQHPAQQGPAALGPPSPRSQPCIPREAPHGRRGSKAAQSAVRLQPGPRAQTAQDGQEWPGPAPHCLLTCDTRPSDHPGEGLWLRAAQHVPASSSRPPLHGEATRQPRAPGQDERQA